MLCHSIDSLYLNATFNLMSTKARNQPDWSPCRSFHLIIYANSLFSLQEVHSRLDKMFLDMLVRGADEWTQSLSLFLSPLGYIWIHFPLVIWQITSTGCPMCSLTRVGLTLFFAFHPSCPAAQFLLPNSHQPRQNWADRFNTQNSSQPNPVHKHMGRPVKVTKSWLKHWHMFPTLKIQKDPLRPRARLCSRRIHPGTPSPASSRDRDLLHAPQCRRLCGKEIAGLNVYTSQATGKEDISKYILPMYVYILPYYLPSSFYAARSMGSNSGLLVASQPP